MSKSTIFFSSITGQAKTVGILAVVISGMFTGAVILDRTFNAESPSAVPVTPDHTFDWDLTNMSRLSLQFVERQQSLVSISASLINMIEQNASYVQGFNGYSIVGYGYFIGDSNWYFVKNKYGGSPAGHEATLSEEQKPLALLNTFAGEVKNIQLIPTNRTETLQFLVALVYDDGSTFSFSAFGSSVLISHSLFASLTYYRGYVSLDYRDLVSTTALNGTINGGLTDTLNAFKDAVVV